MNATTPQADRESFAVACASLLKGQRSEVEGSVSAREARLDELAQEMRIVSRSLYLDRLRLTDLDEAITSERDRFARDFDEITQLPGVASLGIEAGRIRVTTGVVTIRHEGIDYRIGRFVIDIDLDGPIWMRNIENTSGFEGWDHPHVQGGAPCLGTLQEGCAVLLGRLEFVPLVSLLMQFLETYHPATAYGRVSLWTADPA